ncbi:VirB4 family type IV secretion system protein [Clostridium thermobutyricum]|uniref:VirB4 family type IV secretion system protein n=1 Tax=Clostridium thermobutyricum TaxID=29372 RepID=UPI0018A9B4DC|nr:ATP-binding protein [Clostridium thermobutyricum]
MELKKKTSTHKLASGKDVKRLKNTKVHKLMDEILGFDSFQYIETRKGPIPFILESRNSLSLVMKISSADSYLLADADLSNFEQTLKSFVYGLDNDVKFERTNRRQNFKKYMEFIDLCSKSISDNKVLQNYKELLFNEFKKMESLEGRSVQSNYIIVSSKEINPLVARKEVMDKANYIMNSLNDNNFRVDLVAGLELYEYLYFKFHRNSEIDVEDFIKSESFKLISDSIFSSIHYENITLEEINNYLSKEEEKKAEEERLKIAKMSEKELKKYEKSLKKSQKKNINKEEKLKDDIYRVSLVDILKPDIFSEKEDYIRFATNNYCRMMSIQTLPQTMNILTINSLLEEDMDINIYLKNINTGILRKTLRAKYGKVLSNIQIKEHKTGQVDYGELELAKDINGLIKAVETNTDKVFDAQILVKVWGNDLVELENKTKTAIENFAKYGLALRVLFKHQNEAFINTLPTASFKFKQNLKHVTTGGAACLVPTGCTHLRQPEGVFVGRSLATNSPIILDPFLCQKKQYSESELYSNPNTYVVGIPGSGKSVLIKTQISRSMLQGNVNVTIDPHNEYKQMCDFLGGNYIFLQSGKKTGINPLEINVSIDPETGEKTIALNEKIGEITSMINNFISTYRQGEALRGLEITSVSDAIRDSYAERGIKSDIYGKIDPNCLFEVVNGKKVKKHLPILSDVKRNLYKQIEKTPEIKEVAKMMNIITGDGLMNIFDCETDEKIARLLEDKLLCFSLKELDTLTKNFAMTTLLNWLWGMFSDWKIKDIQKTIWIDEAWSVARDIKSLEIIENFVRSGRKYWIAIAIASQSIDEFLATKEGKAILNFCDTRYIFRQDANLSKQIGEFFGLPISAQNKLPSFKKGQCIINTALTNVVAQVDLFEFEKEFATT